MIALALLAVQVTAPAAAANATVAPMPPVDWSALPLLDYRRSGDPSPNAYQFVRAEVLSGRCPAATRTPGGWTLTVNLAVLGTPAGRVRRIVPRAIQCPTVEQYAAGIALSMARDNIDPAPGNTDQWYRTSVTFTWSQ